MVKQIQDENGNVTENKDPVLVRHTISKRPVILSKIICLELLKKEQLRLRQVEGMPLEVRLADGRKPPEEMENIWSLSSDMHHRKIHRSWCTL